MKSSALLARVLCGCIVACDALTAVHAQTNQPGDSTAQSDSALEEIVVSAQAQ